MDLNRSCWRSYSTSGRREEEEEVLTASLLDSPLKALIFLFKWIGGDSASADGVQETPAVPHYFA